MHKYLVLGGKLSKEFGRFYDKAFAERQEADYNALAVSAAQDVRRVLTKPNNSLQPWRICWERPPVQKVPKSGSN